MSEQSNPTNVPQFELRHRLDLAMEWAGLKPEDMATEIGRSATTIRNYLSGRTTPDRGHVIAWALRCGVPFGWLESGMIDLTDTPEPDGPEGINDRRTRRGQSSGRVGWFNQSAALLDKVA